MIKSNGPKTDPWGTPLATVRNSDFTVFIDLSVLFIAISRISERSEFDFYVQEREMIWESLSW